MLLKSSNIQPIFLANFVTLGTERGANLFWHAVQKKGAFGMVVDISGSYERGNN